MAPNRNSKKGKNPQIKTKAKNMKKRKSTQKKQHVSKVAAGVSLQVSKLAAVRSSQRIHSATTVASRTPPKLQLSGKSISAEEPGTLRKGVIVKSCATQYEEAPSFKYDQVQFLIFDTNILVLHLDLVKKCTKATLNSCPVVVYIPYRVLTELDGLHHSSNVTVKNQAGNAIRYLYKNLNALSTLIGQSQEQMKKWRKYGETDDKQRNNDDDVMDAAIGLQKEGIASRVLVATDDKNLVTKCRVNNIAAETTRTLTLKLNI